MVVVVLGVGGRRRDAAVPAADDLDDAGQTQLGGGVTQRHLLVGPHRQRTQCRLVVRLRLARHLHRATATHVVSSKR